MAATVVAVVVAGLDFGACCTNSCWLGGEIAVNFCEILKGRAPEGRDRLDPDAV